MTAPRFFVTGSLTAGATAELDSDDAHHASNVLRMRSGDRIVVIAAGEAWDAVIEDAGCASARITGRSEDAGSVLSVEVTVLQALTKGAKFDEVVEKCVELGARRIVPVRCERSEADASPARVQRWRRIARAAAQQSRRNVVPEVEPPRSFADAISTAGAPLFVAWERAPRGSLAAALRDRAQATALAIAIGPEGSFSDAEIERAKEAGAAFVSLGPTILRTETAAAALLAAIASARDW